MPVHYREHMTSACVIMDNPHNEWRYEVGMQIVITFPIVENKAAEGSTRLK